MIHEKVSLVRLRARISIVYSKLLPINDLVFEFLIKNLNIALMNFFTEYQIRRYVHKFYKSIVVFL